MLKIKIFYPLVTLFTCIDLMVNIALIWSSLRLTGSPLMIGVILSISVLVPFVTRLAIAKYNSKKGKKSVVNLNQTFVIRTIAYVVIGSIFFFYTQENIPLIIMIAFISGVVNYITISDFEAQNTLYVLAGKISKTMSARVVETAMQVGACLGSFLGGVLIAHLSLPSFIEITAMFAIASALLAMNYYSKQKRNARVKDQTDRHHSQSTPLKLEKYDYWLVIAFSIGLGLIGFHVGSFNILVPVVYQQINDWSAALLGSASGIAGVGALFASLSPNSRRYVPAVIMLVIVSDILVVHARNAWFSVGVCLFIGYSINYIRIAIRERLIHFSINENYAHRIASLSMFNYLFFRGFSPLLVSLLVSQYCFGISSAPMIFVLIGLFSGICLLIPFCFSKRRQENYCEVAHE